MRVARRKCGARNKVVCESRRGNGDSARFLRELRGRFHTFLSYKEIEGTQKNPAGRVKTSRVAPTKPGS